MTIYALRNEFNEVELSLMTTEITFFRTAKLL